MCLILAILSHYNWDMYFVIRKYKMFKQLNYEIVKNKAYNLEANAKKVCEAYLTLNDDKDVEYFIIEALEGNFLQPKEAKQLELPLS